MTVNDGKDLSQDAHAKDLESMGISVVSGSHPLTLLDSNPIIVKILEYLTQYLLLMKQ